MSEPIQITITGTEKLIANLRRFEKEIRDAMRGAGREAAAEILDTRGLRVYPPITDANRPGRVRTVTFAGGKTVNFRAPYYIRGRGMMVPVRGGDYRQTGNSEKFGSAWHVRYEGKTVISNGASYARYLSGDDQAAHMARIGWRKLVDVAREKLPEVTRIYQAWIDRIIGELNLR